MRRFIREASMGPRSNDRGNVHAIIGHWSVFAASMGPRSNDRGNYFTGHERRQAPRELQWGRDQMIAEMLDKRANVRRIETASMGPRSNDRGNEQSNRTIWPYRVRLQWGRDQMIAEMYSRKSRTEKG